jgi:hypothetical protein
LTLLDLANHKKSYDDIELLLQFNVMPNAERECHFLDAAVETGDLSIVQLILDNTTGVAADLCRTPFYTACMKGYADICKFFLDSYDFDADSPLLDTCARGHCAIIDMLINAGATSHAEARPFEDEEQESSFFEYLLQDWGFDRGPLDVPEDSETKDRVFNKLLEHGCFMDVGEAGLWCALGSNGTVSMLRHVVGLGQHDQQRVESALRSACGEHRSGPCDIRMRVEVIR